VHDVTSIHRDAVRLAGALETASEHPVGRALAAYADVPVPGAEVTEFANEEGVGVAGVVEGHRVRVGRVRSDTPQESLPPDLAAAVAAARDAGLTAVRVDLDDQPAAVFAVGDTVKETSAEAVRRFRELGLTNYLLTGDHASAADAVARQVGISHVIAEVLPADKAAAVARLQDEGRRVAMVGDGVNDAAALVAADLGVAMGTGTAVAIEAGDLTLISGDLRAAADAIELSRRTLATIKQNLFWAFAYNVVGIPLAALGLLNPMIAGAAMALSSVCVVSNSLRLRRFQPTQ
jgi:Cu+-exporting ATPase